MKITPALLLVAAISFGWFYFATFCAIVIALSGRYEQILNYVVSVDFIWFGLTGVSLFVFRRRAKVLAETDRGVEARAYMTPADRRAAGAAALTGTAGFRVPGHPFTTLCFVAACWLIVLSTIWKYPQNSVIGLIIVLAGLPVYLSWRRRRV